MNVQTIEAPSVAAFAAYLLQLPHETWANIVATENGTPWARVNIHPLTDTRRSVFPTDATGVTGDTRKRGQAGIILTDTHAARVVVERARRMFR